MCVKIILTAWSCASVLWWLISWRLVITAVKPSNEAVPLPSKKSLTIFKPLPPLDGRGLEVEAHGLESFISQLDDKSELLLGVHELDGPDVLPFVERMRAVYPRAKIIVVCRSEPDTLANPKIAWEKILVSRASGELWLWSDADIIAPPDFLAQAQSEFEASHVEMLTFPYAIRTLPHPLAILDALFVNAEFYPGALLLRRLGPVDFGLGAAMLFSRDNFLRKVDWEKLGSALADDFMLGQMLQPVQLGSITLETVADVTSWQGALGHYYRWKKTVYWCRPMGFAAQILVMPLLGWIFFVALHPSSLLAWGGFLGMIQLDVLFAALICQKIGCPLTGRSWLALEAWSMFRVFFWIACWFPGQVRWREKCWCSFRQSV
jgi:ceramide glucosyltransferase